MHPDINVYKRNVFQQVDNPLREDGAVYINCTFVNGTWEERDMTTFIECKFENVRFSSDFFQQNNVIRCQFESCDLSQCCSGMQMQFFGCGTTVPFDDYLLIAQKMVSVNRKYKFLAAWVLDRKPSLHQFLHQLLTYDAALTTAFATEIVAWAKHLEEK
jgi:hypothetical protein